MADDILSHAADRITPQRKMFVSPEIANALACLERACRVATEQSEKDFARELIAASAALAAYLEQQAMEGRAIEAVKQLAEAVSWFVAESREPE
jgi:hypothetical protein